MRKLYLLGYAPADKEAWPHGGLSKKLEALDLRHGVAPNLVMTPLLSCACHLLAGQQSEFLSYVSEHVLSGGDGKPHRRYNVLARNVGKELSEIDGDVEELFAWVSESRNGDGKCRFDPNDGICLVFSYWAVSALLSHLIERKVKWTRKDLKKFGKLFLAEVLKQSPPEVITALRLPETLPERDIPRLGLFFRVCVQGVEENMRPVLAASVRELRKSATNSEIAATEVDWIVSVARALVPLPHNEVYQGYKKDTNPIGKYQACFVECRDPKELVCEADSELMWRRVGKAIAQRLTRRERIIR